MKIVSLSPTYISDASSARRQPIPVDVNLDPTINSLTAPFKQSRQNGYISPVGANKSAAGIFLYLQGGSMDGVVNPPPPSFPTGTGASTTPTGNCTPDTSPTTVSNLTAQYEKDANDNYTGSVVVNFDLDLSNLQNQFFSYLAVSLSADNGTTYNSVTPINPYDSTQIDPKSVHQTITIKNQSIGGLSTTGLYNTTGFTNVAISVQDEAHCTNGYVFAPFTNTYVSPLPAPALQSKSDVSSYSIVTSNIDKVKTDFPGLFLEEAFEEFVFEQIDLTSDQVDAAVKSSATGWVSMGSPTTVSPFNVFAADGNHRYIRAFFMDVNGGKSPYSNYVQATPTPLIPTNTLPPNGVSKSSGEFSGDDVIIHYNLPAISDSDPNKLVSLKVMLSPTDQPTQQGFFYHTVVHSVTTNGTGSAGSNTIIVNSAANLVIGRLVSGTGIADGAVITAINGTTITLSLNNSGDVSGSLLFFDASFTIPKNLIFSQLGNYFSSYSGKIYGVSQYGTESTSIANIDTFSRNNAMTTLVPKATISNVVDGYTVQFSLGNSGADHGSVYQLFIDPTGSFDTVDLPDYMDGTYYSGGTSGQKTLVVQSISMENGNFVLPDGKSINTYIGYGITGTGIPTNTWVTSISGSGPYTLTLNNNLTEQAAGNYHMQSLVYSGQGPANIFNNYYATPTYLILRYYDIYGSSSLNSLVYLVTPTNPSTSVINNSVRIGAPSGAIWVGNSGTASATNGARIVLGSSQDGTYSGIFAFDGGSTSLTAPTTSIISNDNNGHSYTFETVNAKIANWVVGTDRIQNSLGTSSNYVGLAATGPYSFWAGSTTSGGDASANFTVTPTGNVSARNLSIYGRNSTALAGASGDGTTMTYTTSSPHNLVSGQYVTISNTLQGGDARYSVSSQQITVTSPTTFTISGSGTGNLSTGSLLLTTALITAGSYLTIMSDGTVNASNANITGSLRVSKSSFFDSDITISSTGYLQTNGSGGSYVRVGGANSGIVAYSGSEITTQISATNAGATFATKNAYLGGLDLSTAWHVTSGLITSKNGLLELNANDPLNNAAYITAYPLNYDKAQLNYGTRLYGGTSISNGYALTVGSLQLPSSTGGAGTITNVSASGDGTTMTYTTSVAHGLQVKQSVVITGLVYTGSGNSEVASPFNVYYKPVDSVPSSTSFTIKGSGTGSAINGNISYGANFSVDHAGFLKATNAQIYGDVRASSFTIDGNNYWNDTGHEGNFRIGASAGTEKLLSLPSDIKGYMIYDSTDGLRVYGNISAVTGLIGNITATNPKYWTIRDKWIISNEATDASYIKLDAETDAVTSYGLSDRPGYATSFTSTITGGAIGSAYDPTTTATTSKSTTSLRAGQLVSDHYITVTPGLNSDDHIGAFQVLSPVSSTSNPNAPVISVDPTGNSTTFTETGTDFGGGAWSKTYSGSNFISNASVSFLNSGSVILGSGSGITDGTATASSSYIYINGLARIRNGTPVGTGTGSYIRNTYVSAVKPSPTSNTGFVGDLWVQTS